MQILNIFPCLDLWQKIAMHGNLWITTDLTWTWQKISLMTGDTHVYLRPVPLSKTFTLGISSSSPPWSIVGPSSPAESIADPGYTPAEKDKLRSPSSSFPFTSSSSPSSSCSPPPPPLALPPPPLGSPPPPLAAPPPPPLQSRHTISPCGVLFVLPFAGLDVLFSQKFSFEVMQKNRIGKSQAANSPSFDTILRRRPVCSLTRRLLADQTSGAGTRRLHGRPLQAAARPLQGIAQGLQGPAQKLQNPAQMLQESARTLEGPKRACTKTKWYRDRIELSEAGGPLRVHARLFHSTRWFFFRTTCKQASRDMRPSGYLVQVRLPHEVKYSAYLVHCCSSQDALAFIFSGIVDVPAKFDLFKLLLFHEL